jgi:hypothetical protein
MPLAAEVIARLEHGHRETGLDGVLRGDEPTRSGADDRDASSGRQGQRFSPR